MIKRLRIGTFLLGTLILAGCGFQLRGAGSIPDALAPLALDCADDIPGPLCSEVREQLELYQLLAGDGEEPAHTLKLVTYEQNRRTSALTDRAAAAEYEIQATVGLRLITSDDIPLLADTQLSASEVYRADEEQVLAGEREQSGIEGVLQQQLAQQVTRRLTPFTEERIRLLREQYDADEDSDNEGS
ncbi:LPS-assembly lipoprotein [Halospina denitrificans]|uniref:LPS-assembly lipoprotein LptE n=1 Tax=Halospina denitrificans TaxID=332522 RepID=A0A4R7JZ84_9GAMM|nr:LPS assembly lipoprotein LptE [Halospina denitrificans]TDT43274.1 LPS-assembly lipoprotein [Halospina denitrificans]